MRKLVLVIVAGLSSPACKSSESTDQPAAKVSPPATVAPAAPAPPPPSKVLQIEGKGTFTGLSKDGKRFAWLAPSTAGILWLKVAELGVSDPVLTLVDNVDAPEVKAKLAEFSPDRRAAGRDLTLRGDITATPPTLAVVRGDKSVSVPIGAARFEPTDSAEIWGVSGDGKYLAIHIAGKDVPGLLSKGGGADFHSFFVVTAP